MGRKLGVKSIFYPKILQHGSWLKRITVYKFFLPYLMVDRRAFTTQALHCRNLRKREEQNTKGTSYSNHHLLYSLYAQWPSNRPGRGENLKIWPYNLWLSRLLFLFLSIMVDQLSVCWVKIRHTSNVTVCKVLDSYSRPNSGDF